MEIKLKQSGDKVILKESEITGGDYIKIMNSGLIDAEGEIKFGNIVYTLPIFAERVIKKDGNVIPSLQLNNSYINNLPPQDIQQLLEVLGERVGGLLSNKKKA